MLTTLMSTGSGCHIKEESFDCVVSDQVIEHLENPGKAIAESHRVLKKAVLQFILSVL